MQLIFDFPVNPDYSLGSFVPCSGNQTALKFVHRVIAGEERLLYLHGETGSGKTHLLHAAAKELPHIGSTQVIPVELVTHDNLDEILTSASAGQSLLLDNLHSLADSGTLRSAFWQLFNDFYDSGRRIIATADLPPKELGSLDDHLKSRFMWGLVAKLDISDDESRRMIMRKLADDRQIIIPDEVIDYLLIRLPRDIPSLAYSVERLQQESFATQRKISLKLAREIMQTNIH